jgi:hypothetical protein
MAAVYWGTDVCFSFPPLRASSSSLGKSGALAMGKILPTKKGENEKFDNACCSDLE